jgi:hypothetical protein
MRCLLCLLVSVGPLTAASLAIVSILSCSPILAQQISQASALPAPADSFVTIVTGNTFQQVLASITTDRRLLRITNNNTNGDTCWVFVGTGHASKEKSDKVLTPGDEYERYWPFAPSDEVQATCASSSDTLRVEYQ